MLTSPMFTPAQSGGGIAVNGYQGAHGDGMGLHYTADSAPQSPGNLAALPIGDVAAVGSPPYADERLTGQRQFRSRFHPQRPLAAEADADRYGDHVGDLAKLPIGDVAAVCSPPYEASISASKGKGGIEWQPEWGPRRDNSQITTGMRYSESPDNLGNREGETYWSAIACILEQLWELLPPGGHVAWVVKAFVRNRQLVDLPAMSLRLMESLVCWIDAMQVAEAKQFSLMPEIVPHYRKSRKSFFRRNAEAKGSPAIDAEVVLVVRKPAA
ncbi:MAG: hypothetical protein NTZ05_16680 [Chloroflexi bacterium]|nr:hypothetical protein [Chloroflexota bacterium]